jgi:phosphate transport system substrate-binding protein
MNRTQLRETSTRSLAMLFAVMALPEPVAASFFSHSLSAQLDTPASSLVAISVPADTAVRIDGTRSMETFNQTLQQQFEERFPNIEVTTEYNGNDAALQALRNGEIDIAAIGRTVTEAETEGLVEEPQPRRKIAIVVGEDNPFAESLTIEQFAAIFRGEITDWAEVGGTAGAIRVIDRPATSDTRQAFRNYPVFQTAPFETGSTAVSLSEDSTAAVIAELGTDGIGYAIVDQVANVPGVKIVPMHGTLPTDERYPFSQPFTYLYRSDANPGVLAFLGYAPPEGEAAGGTSNLPTDSSAALTEQAIAPEVAVPAIVAAPEITETTSPRTPFRTPIPDPNLRTYNQAPWWLWWLSLPVLGGLLWWLLRDRGMKAPVGAAIAGAAVPGEVLPESRLILTPRNCKAAYAYWEVPEATKEAARRQGGKTLSLMVYDVTDIDIDYQTPHGVQQFTCNEQLSDCHVPIPTDNRDYLAELGYVTEDDRWIKLARSAHVRVPACPIVQPQTNDDRPIEQDRSAQDKPTQDKPAQDKPPVTAGEVATAGTVATTGVAVATALHSYRTGLPVAESVPPHQESRLIITPRNANYLYAYWEVPEDHKAELREQGGRKLALRLYDVTDINLDEQAAHSIREYECHESASDLQIPIAEPNRDYLAELGYITEGNRWLVLARSAFVRVPPFSVSGEATSEAATPPTQTGLFGKVQHYGDFTPNNEAGVQYYGESASGQGGVRQYGDFTPNDESTVQQYGDFTPNNEPAIQQYGDFTPHDEAGIQYYGAASSASQPVYEQSRIVLVPRNSKNAYAYWEIAEADRASAKRQGGTTLVLRVYEATEMNLDFVPAYSVQQFECEEWEQDHHVPIPITERDYVAEMGYTTADGRWLSIARSLHVRVSELQPIG